MKRLTEEMIIARTKISDISKIKRLNCWGTELADVTVLRRMPNVEVLSLSINKINSLADFQNCRQLQELYVRQNDLKDLNQVCYLQNLSNLQHLWLGENPCATTEGYRLSVIRALPQLQKLDNIIITPEELSDALKKGKILIHPEEQQDEPEEEFEPPPPPPQGGYRAPQEYAEQYYASPERSPPRELNYEPGDTTEFDEEMRESDSSARQSPPRRQSDLRRSYTPESEAPAYYEDRRNANSYEQESPRHQQYYERSSKEFIENARTSPESPKESKFPNSNSNNSMKEYSNGDRHYSNQVPQYRQEGSDGSNNSHSGGMDPPRRVERCEKTSCTANHRPPFNRRPVTRNSNILSAVLCLVKELDYPSLEVVEMAVRCRMDEFME